MMNQHSVTYAHKKGGHTVHSSVRDKIGFQQMFPIGDAFA